MTEFTGENMQRIINTMFAVSIALMVAGCDPPPEAFEPLDSTEEPSVSPSETPTVASDVESDDSRADEPSGSPDATANETEQTASEQARVGVGSRGQGYGGGFVSEPARVYFRIKERLVFQVQIPQALSAHKATRGRGPQSQEEFDEMIEESGIKLPDLPEGAEYVYDPEEEELMVRRPR
jgi:hypothetical protein